MAQRPHSARLGSSHPGQARAGGASPGAGAVDIARSPPQSTYGHAPAADSSARGLDQRTRPTHHGAAYSQRPVRLPPNSGSPAGVAQTASLSSSHSSSPSPSPSINPYGGSLRSMLHGAPAQAGALPANIRRVGSTQGRSEAVQQRRSADGPAADRPQHSLPAHHAAPAARDARCEQIVQNFYSKAAQVIAHLRGHDMARRAGDPDASAAPGPTGSSVLYASSASSSVADVGATGRPVNKWFNLNLEEIGSVREEVKPWRHAAVTRHPPPMFIEVCLDVSRVSAADSLHVTDIHGRPWTVDLERSLQSGAGAAAAASESGSIRRRRRARRATAIVLEVWRLDLDTAAVITPAPDLPRVYKQAIVFFRNLYAFASLLPCMTLARQIGAGAGGLALFCQFRAEPSARAGVVDLDVGLTNTARFLESHSFGPVVTPMGTFSMGVQYRRECIFSSSSPQDDALHDSIAGLDAVDDTYFTPTLSSRSGSNFSAHPQRHGLPMEPLREAASMGPGNNNLHAMRRAHTAVSPEPHSQRHAPHGSSLSGEWGLTAPSINPFRARPLSVGDSASLPSYIGSVLHQQTLARQPSDSRPSNAGLPGAVRIPAASAEPHRALLGSRGHASRLSHQGHSPDHRSSLLSSSAAAAAEAGSSLHRSAILRRLGGPTSPAEPQRRLDLISRSSGNEPFVGSKSPPRPGASSFRSISSGSAGSIPTGRSVLGVAPFKSPSLAESPGLGLGMFADIGALAAHAASNEHSGTAGDASRRRGHTVPHGGSLRESGSAAEALLATATRVSGSPSSFGTNASGHSRRLSSSFGNRRTSAEARRTSILGMSVTERPGTSVTGPPEAAAASRRHTILEGQVWLGLAGNEQQDIGDFIDMIDNKRLLKAHTHRSPPASQRARGAGAPHRPALTTIPSMGADDDAGAERPRGSPPPGPLQRYQGILDEFNGLSRDMEDSILLPGKTLTVAADEMALGSIADGELSGSPFRRAAIPNPLRSSADRPKASAAPRTGAAAPLSPTAPVAPQADTGDNVDLLRQAFDGMAIESLQASPPSRSTAVTPTLMSPISPRAARDHVRSAAAGLDPESERPLPLPLAIPRHHYPSHPTSGHARSQQRQQQQRVQASADLDSDDSGDAEASRLDSVLRRMRGNSQPAVHIAEQRGGTAPRAVTARSPPLQAQSSQLHSLVSRAPAARTGADSGPFSYRSDFTAGRGRLGALLSAGDDRSGAAKGPRSTPSTPSQAPSAILAHNGDSDSDAGERGRYAGGARRESEQLRSNFPPLSFILPRNRVERDARPRPSSQEGPGSGSRTDDEDMMFQMDTSLH